VSDRMSQTNAYEEIGKAVCRESEGLKERSEK
jgi:hypothetical protein